MSFNLQQAGAMDLTGASDTLTSVTDHSTGALSAGYETGNGYLSDAVKTQIHHYSEVCSRVGAGLVLCFIDWMLTL